MIYLTNNRISLTSVVENAQWKKDHTSICPICGKPFIDYGKNQYPVMGNGRCCDDCNPWVATMFNWLSGNHDRLKRMVDKLSCNNPTARCNVYYINGESVAFTFYRDISTKKLGVVAVCDDECREKVVVGILQNWITHNYADKNLKDVKPFSRGLIRNQINQVKEEFKEKIMDLALKHKNLNTPYLIFDGANLNIDDTDVAHFGLFIWSKGDGVLDVEPFYLGINEYGEFARWWGELAKGRFLEMINEDKDMIPYFPANSKEEAMCEMYKRIFNQGNISLTIK